MKRQWRPRQELNLRPLAPEASALSAELRERDVLDTRLSQSMAGSAARGAVSATAKGAVRQRVRKAEWRTHG